MIKKLLSIALCVLLVLITCAANSFAEPIIVEPLGPIENDGLHVTFLLLEAACKEAIIPEHCDGIPVVSLEAGALDDFPQVERLHIPASITFIAEGVFAAHPNMMIVAEEGSYAWLYAKEHGLKLWLGDPAVVNVSYRSVLDSNTVYYSEEIECERGHETIITANLGHIPTGCSLVSSDHVSVTVSEDGVASHTNVMFLTSATPTPIPTSTPSPKPTATPTPKPTATPKVLEIGDIVIMGTYEQDNRKSNGTETIEWQVLDIQNNKALLISRYVLDHVDYHTKQTSVTWESCYMRRWLNNSFIKNAFTDDEQEMILSTTVKAQKNPHLSSAPKNGIGNDTKDKIFLLNVVEAEQYFDSDWDRQCEGTEYALAQGVSSDGTYCNWLLRQPHKFGTTVPCVNFEGSTNDGVNVSAVRTGMRPAMWVDIGLLPGYSTITE